MINIKNTECLSLLHSVGWNQVDLIVTDPPYGISFMGKDWDKALPDVKVWKECFRVLKPGGFAYIMSLPRSDVQWRMTRDLEEVGFNVAFTPLYWTYATGFPKAGNIGKLVDKRLGAEREKIPVDATAGTRYMSNAGNHRPWMDDPNHKIDGKEPVSDKAKELDGSYAGFQPKPAVEVIIVAMKPLSEKTYTDQAMKNSKGITWLNDCRIPFGIESDNRIGTNANAGGSQKSQFGSFSDVRDKNIQMYKSQGRFPANLLVSDDVLNEYSRFFSLDAWAEKTLPFLIVPKPSKVEKGKDNIHPTCKPVKLMSYLITMGSRKGDTVLDPFMGSGTTGVAAKQLGRKFIGSEINPEYFEIAANRLSMYC